MKFRSWWLYFLFLVLLMMLAGLGAGSYLLYRQHMAVQAISEDTRLLMLRAERLEALVQEQENIAILAQQAAQERAEREAAAATKEKKAKTPEPEKKPAAATATAATEAPPTTKAPLPPEPVHSDMVGVKLQRYAVKGSDIALVFDVTNQNEGNDPAMGYVTVVLRGERGGRPWIEAWPPMRLSPLGRPLNYRRGTPFSVQRYRRLTARFAKGDKKVDRIEFLVYDRQGKLILVRNHPLGKHDQDKDQEQAKPKAEDKG